MEDLSLEKIDAVRFALEQAATVQEIKHVIDTAAAAATYARQVKSGQEIQLRISEYVVRAERKLGEILQAAKAAGQIGRGYQFHKKESSNVEADDITKPTLADAGISRDLSSRAQKLANVPAAEFEQRISDQKETGKLSPNKIVKQGKNGSTPIDKPKRTNPPKEHDLAPLVIGLHDQGASKPEIAGQTGLTERMVREIIEEENIRRDAQAKIDPDRLSLTAKEKLDLAIKQHIRKLNQEFEVKLHEAIKRYLSIRSEEMQKERAEMKRVMDGRQGFMSRVTYKKILACLHPDWVTDAKQKARYEEAFREFNKLEKCLLNEKESPTTYADLPKTMAEWEALRRQTAEARKAKRNQQNAINKP